MLKKFLGVAAVLALTAPVAVIAASPASAAGGTTCTKQSGAATIKPGLGTTKKDQTVTATTTLGGCSGSVKSGKGTSTLKIKNSNCSGLGQTGTKMSLTESIKWNTGKTSKLTGTSTTGPKVGQATIKLKVTSGPFAGLHASTVIAFTPNGGGCTDANPLTKLKITKVKNLVIK
jgi:hypothetical protein